MTVFRWLDCHKLRQTEWNGIIKYSSGCWAWYSLIPKSSLHGCTCPCAEVDRELWGEATTYDKCIKQMRHLRLFLFWFPSLQHAWHYSITSRHATPPNMTRKKPQGQGSNAQAFTPSLTFYLHGPATHFTAMLSACCSKHLCNSSSKLSTKQTGPFHFQ